MVNGIRDEVIRRLFTVRIKMESPIQRRNVLGDHAQSTNAAANAAKAAGGKNRTPVRAAKKPGRNDPCPCGSGKKYKKCCGRND